MKKIIALACLFLITIACKKEDVTLSSGTFSGTFTVKYDSQVLKGQTTVKLENDGSYSGTQNPDRIPAGGSGTYTITGNKIEFQDINFRTADFDWHLVLNGEYTYTFNGNNLKIRKEIKDIGTYEYNLTRD